MRGFLVALGFSIFISGPVIAAADATSTKRGNPDLKKYCTGDALTHCGDIDSDDPAMGACFKTNREKLTENCRRAMDAYMASSKN
ncbi:cysteine rich repeat-containing protein [Methylobacterium sp. CM6247]